MLELAGVLSCRAATAYELHGWQYDHSAITVLDISNAHGSECARALNLNAPAREAFSLWTAHGDVQYLDVSLWVYGVSTVDIVISCGPDPTISPVATAEPHATDGVVSWCEILLGAPFFEMAHHWQVNVLAHELGHCFGVYHSPTGGIMRLPFVLDFNADDAAAIRSLYPYSNRLVGSY